MAAEETQRTFDVTQQFRLSGDITPATITADQDNYNPPGLDTAGVLRLASDANNRTLTGLADGADGRILVLINIGATTIILSNQNTASAAANRFEFGADVEIAAAESKAIIYDATASRWRSLDNAIADATISARRILANAVDNFKLRDSGALSVIGRSANSTGDPADISATAASDHVLRESGSVLGFGTVATGGIANDAVTFAKMQNLTASRLLGRGSAGGTGDPEEITLGTNLSMSGTTLNATGGGGASLVDYKDSCRAATTGNITLSGTQTIDDVAVIAGDRVLVKNQTTGSENGIYDVSAGAWTRSADADTSAEVTACMVVGVSEGTVNADTLWMLTTNDPITLGTTSLTFRPFGLLSDTAPVDVSSTAASAGTSNESARRDHKHAIAANTIGNAEIRQGSARSVIGRSANSTGNVADIAGTTAGFALTDDGSTLAFRAVDTLPEDIALSGDISHTLGAGNNNDNAPTGLSTASTIRYTPNSAGSTLTGLTGGADGRVLLLLNIGTVASITITHQDTNSTAANRFVTPDGLPLVLGPTASAMIQYDSTTSRWRVIEPTVTNLPQTVAIQGDITPSTLSAGDNNDYNPTDLGISTVLRLTGNANASNITGIAGGADGRILVLQNVGTPRIRLIDQSASSTAANRFAFGINVELDPGQTIVIIYDSTQSRWVPFTNYRSDDIYLPPPIIEDFIIGSTETGEIGQYHWSFTSFGIVQPNVVNNHPGVIQTQSNSTIGSVNRLRLSSADTATLTRQDQWSKIVLIFAPETSTFDFDWRYGLMNNSSSNPPTDGVYMEKLNTDTNYFVVTRAASVQTRTDSGVAAASGTYAKITMRKNGSNIDFFINDTFIAQHTTNIPGASTGLVPTQQQVPTAANARTCSLDAFYLYWNTQTR